LCGQDLLPLPGEVGRKEEVWWLWPLSRVQTRAAAFSGGLDALGNAAWVEGRTDAHRGAGVRACSVCGYGLRRTASTEPLAFTPSFTEPFHEVISTLRCFFPPAVQAAWAKRSPRHRGSPRGGGPAPSTSPLPPPTHTHECRLGKRGGLKVLNFYICAAVLALCLMRLASK